MSFPNKKSIEGQLLKDFLRARSDVRHLVRSIELFGATKNLLILFEKHHFRIKGLKFRLAGYKIYPCYSIYDEPLAKIIQDRDERRGKFYGPKNKVRARQRNSPVKS